MKIINNNNNNNNKGDSDYYYFCAMIKKVAVPILVACFFVVAAQAEVLVIKAPLTWGLDKSAEYPLPKVLNGIYTTDQFVATEGQVSAITMNWESRGAISMEVSADNGLQYTPVINGVPLESGFVSGDRIRWRAQALNEDAQLTAVNLSYSDTSGVIGDFGQPLLSGFMYRKEFIVRNDSREDLYNYQMKLRIGESELAKDADICLSKKAKEDFSDIRISASDGKRILSYYLESIEGELPGKRSAVIWVNIPQLPKEKDLKLYLYYGNPQALSLSSGEQTFDFFDDFKDPAKSNEKWITYTEKNGTLQLKNGEIKLDAAEAITKDFLFKEGIVEYPVEIESGFENSLNLRVQNGNSYDIPLWSGYSSLYKGAEHCSRGDSKK